MAVAALTLARSMGNLMGMQSPGQDERNALCDAAAAGDAAGVRRLLSAWWGAPAVDGTSWHGFTPLQVRACRF